MRIRWRGVARVAAIVLVALLAMRLLPGLLRAPEPPPLGADVGLPKAKPASMSRPVVAKPPRQVPKTAKRPRPKSRPSPARPKPTPGRKPSPAPEPSPGPVESTPPEYVPAPAPEAVPEPPPAPPPTPGDGSQEFAPR